jgi:nucleotide-binding universal stress UspA family protein
MYQRILVPVDGSDISKLALQHAIKFSKDQHAQIKIVHVVAQLAALGAEGHISLDKFFRKNGMDLVNEAAAIVREGGIAAETALLESQGLRPSAVIVEEARNWPADIIVIGSSGRGRVDEFIFGSVAEGVLRTASVPVLLMSRMSLSQTTFELESKHGDAR